MTKGGVLRLFISDFLVNLCILAALIFTYQQLRWKLNIDKHSKTTSHLIDGIAGGLLGTLLISYSISVTNETFVDLRFLPVMLLMIFIGWKPAVLSAVIIMLTRFLFGISLSAFAAAIWIAAALICFLLIHKRMKTSEGLYKKASCMIAAASSIFSIIVIYLVRDFAMLAYLIPLYWGVAFLGGLICVFLVDYQRKSNYLLKRYKKEASMDYLTGLNNVRSFDQVWNQKMQTAEEKEEVISLLLIDIDFFKQVNDTYGHSAGDAILIELSGLLRKSTRSFDIISRNGGEEFSVILPFCSHQQAVEIAQRIQQTIASHEFAVEGRGNIRLTVSIGVATYPETVDTPENVVERADQLMYEAKRAGRNRVFS